VPHAAALVDETANELATRPGIPYGSGDRA
jgi:hypothetical protein